MAQRQRVQELRARVAQLRKEIAAKELEVEAQERLNIEAALRAKAVLAPGEVHLAEVSQRLTEAQEDESAARAELAEGDEESRLILQSGKEHEADLQGQIAEALAKATSAEQNCIDLATQVEREALELLSCVAVFEKRKDQLARKLDTLGRKQAS